MKTKELKSRYIKYKKTLPKTFSVGTGGSSPAQEAVRRYQNPPVPVMEELEGVYWDKDRCSFCQVIDIGSNIYRWSNGTGASARLPQNEMARLLRPSRFVKHPDPPRSVVYWLNRA